MERNPMTHDRRKAPKALLAAALVLVLAVAATMPVAAATALDVKALRTEVAATNNQIIALMQEARDGMAAVRTALQDHVRAMAKVAPEEAAALKARLDSLRERMLAIVAEREFYAEQMVAFRADMLAKKFDDAYAVLQAVQARQTQWKAALETFISDAESLAADIQALADQTGPIWEQKKAEQAAFLAALKEKKDTLLANHEAVQAKVQQLNDLLAQIRERLQAGALSGLSAEDVQWVKDQLASVRTGIGQTFDGSVAHQMQLFHQARLDADHAAALAALDQAIAIQAQRPAILDGYIATAQAVLDKLEPAPTAPAPTDAAQS